MELDFSRHIFEKYSIKFHEYLSSGSRVVLCYWTDGQTDMTKLTVFFFAMFAKAPKQSAGINEELLDVRAVVGIVTNDL